MIKYFFESSSGHDATIQNRWTSDINARASNTVNQ